MMRREPHVPVFRDLFHQLPHLGIGRPHRAIFRFRGGRPRRNHPPRKWGDVVVVVGKCSCRSAGWRVLGVRSGRGGRPATRARCPCASDSPEPAPLAYRTVWNRGGGTHAASRASNESGAISTASVPSAKGRFRTMRTRPSLLSVRVERPVRPLTRYNAQHVRRPPHARNLRHIPSRGPA